MAGEVKTRKRSAVGVGVVLTSAVMVLGGATSSWAGTTVTAKTTDDNPGGYATFLHNGNTFKVTDMQKDGLRASGYIKFNGKTHRLDDANGAKTLSSAGSVTRHYSMKEGTYVQIRVCLRDGANGRARFCSAWKSALA
ncbi:hypothetical protein I3F58_04140 [Streptomyces sp. MUM 203J]|uniref:hypothetical protein n=1 Tax=Streptomyces sp. MUM 203J TaxID=2791990 RepID=UPI001F0376F9|nr:hypothetical protein [Streptomyces sp. MUM 203J]MCH0538759.1 hypothetical protein [Streptomyces sp. MUM 203J]